MEGGVEGGHVKLPPSVYATLVFIECFVLNTCVYIALQ